MFHRQYLFAAVLAVLVPPALAQPAGPVTTAPGRAPKAKDKTFIDYFPLPTAFTTGPTAASPTTRVRRWSATPMVP